MFDARLMESINHGIEKKIASNTVNRLKVFAVGDTKKLSVTLSADKQVKHLYHGLHPSFDSNRLYDLLCHGADINSDDGFWTCVKSVQEEQVFNLIIGKDFMDGNPCLSLIPTDGIEELKEVLLGRAILHMASHFGYRLKMGEALKEDFLQDLRTLWQSNFSNRMSVKELERIFTEDTKSEFVLKGIWPKAVIEGIQKKYAVHRDGEELVLVRRSRQELVRTIEISSLLTFSTDEIRRYFKLIDCEVYYSGVMPRTQFIEVEEQSVESKNIKSIQFHVCKTTYATVDFMDNPESVNHPFIKNNHDLYQMMLQFDLYEDQLQQEFLYTKVKDHDGSLSTFERNQIDAINQYLKYSMNTHTIAVSANIETDDEYLVIGKRNDLSIDAHEYYCAVNGQSEFQDENVLFYHKSVMEDLPTMNYDSKFRIDLNNEMQRECVAELNINQFKDDWRYLGLSYLSIRNFSSGKETQISLDESKGVKKRRMHFNVLMANATSRSFEDVVSSRKNAVENFENSHIIGFRSMIYANRKEWLIGLGKTLFHLISDNRSVILLVYLLIRNLMRGTMMTGFDFGNWMDLSFLAVYIVTLVHSYRQNRDLRKLTKSKRFTLSKLCKRDLSSMDIDMIFSDFKKKFPENERFHGIFWAMYVLNFVDKSVKRK